MVVFIVLGILYNFGNYLKRYQEELLKCIDYLTASNSDDFYGFIEVTGDEFVTGTYYICDEKSSGASEEPVYKHQDRDSYIFYDPDEGWKIGDQDSMETFDYWYKSEYKMILEYVAGINSNFCILGGHHTLKHWLKNVEWGGGLENPDDKVKLTFHTQGM